MVKIVVDTNVAKLANLAVDIASIDQNKLACVLACVAKITEVMHRHDLVMDVGDEIYQEYMSQLSLERQPGVGDIFMQWVHDRRWDFPEGDRVNITKDGNSYAEFPEAASLKHFDRSDRKFVAVANAHPLKPAISVAEDRGWFNHADGLRDAGINIEFLCPQNAPKSKK